MNLKNSTYKDLWTGDFDNDGIKNIDDTRPFNNKIKRRVNKEISLSEKWNGLKGREKKYRKDIKDLSKIVGAKKGRIKKSYSTIGKQMGRYLENVKDMGGLRVLTNNKSENNKVLNNIKNKFPKCRKDTNKNCIFEVENKYKQKDRNTLPYLGYHIGLRYKGLPYEVQIKCKDMQKIQNNAHLYYKKGQYELINKKFRPQVNRLRKKGC
jgi:(p)ppGpp synthase/HD superfamily hydrolase